MKKGLMVFALIALSVASNTKCIGAAAYFRGIAHSGWRWTLHHIGQAYSTELDVYFKGGKVWLNDGHDSRDDYSTYLQYISNRGFDINKTGVCCYCLRECERNFTTTTVKNCRKKFTLDRHQMEQNCDDLRDQETIKLYACRKACRTKFGADICPSRCVGDPKYAFMEDDYK